MAKLSAFDVSAMLLIWTRQNGDRLKPTIETVRTNCYANRLCNEQQNMVVIMKPRSLPRQTVSVQGQELVAEFSANSSLTMLKPVKGEYTVSERELISKALKSRGIEVRRSHPYCIIVDGEVQL